MKKFLLSALVIVAMTGCKQAQPVNEELPDKAIIAKTRVIESKTIVTDGQAFDLKYIRDDQATQTWNGTLKNAKHGTDNAINFTETYLKDNSNSYFKFFSDNGTNTLTEITWSSLGNTDIVYTQSAWNAGNYNTPIATGIELSHMLTRIEVVLQAKTGENLSAVTASWGNITGIKVEGLANSITYNYASDKITFGALTSLAQDFFAGDLYDTEFSTAAIGANSNSTVVAGIMLPSSVGAGNDVTSVNLLVSANGVTDQSVLVTLGGKLESGKINTITLTFSAKDKTIGASSTVKAWANGVTGGADL